jgi:HEAT repeats
MLLLAGCLAGWQVRTGVAQDDAVLVRMLESARHFRVRAQAALALGRTQHIAHLSALERALGDRHPLVRAAAATALGGLRVKTSLPALRALLTDPARAVAKQARAAIEAIDPGYLRRSAAPQASPATLARLQGVRYVLVVGAMRDKSGFAAADLPLALGGSLSRELASLRRVAVLRADDQAGIAAALDRGLPVLRLDGNVTEASSELERAQVSVHCEISLLVMDEAGRNLRTVLKGAATGIEPEIGVRAQRETQRGRIARKAVEGAVISALRNASSAIENVAASVVVAGKDSATASLP